MSLPEQATTTTIDAAVDGVIHELEMARAANEYREACTCRMRSAIQLAALSMRNDVLARIGHEATRMVISTPASADAMLAGLRAADAESRRLLAQIGIDLPAEPGAPAGGG